jgi:hypothetical protein
MTQTETTTVVVPFEIDGWDETVYDEPAEGPRLARNTVRKRFAGELDATSVAEVLTAQGPGGGGYLASERVTGALAGRRGTFVLQHGGVGDEREGEAFGHVVPGSGTGEIAGLTGQVRYAHDDDGARITLTYALG